MVLVPRFLGARSLPARPSVLPAVALAASSGPVRVDRTGTHEVHSPLTDAVVRRVGGAEHGTVPGTGDAGVLMSADVVDGVPAAHPAPRWRSPTRSGRHGPAGAGPPPRHGR